MNLTVNSLPTRTWNRLGMNESFLAVEGEFNDHSPKAVDDPAEVTWEPRAQWAGEKLLLGTGEDLKALTESAPIGLVETAPGRKMDKYITLTWKYEAQEQSCSRIVLHAAKGSTLNVVLLMESEPEHTGTTAVRTELYA